MGKTIGIDLGTTKSVVSIMEGGKPVIIPNNGEDITYSVVAWKKDARNPDAPLELLVGRQAKNQGMLNPSNTFYGNKRLIGRRGDDPKVKVMTDLASYKIITNGHGDAALEAGMPIYNGSKELSIPQISAQVLAVLKKAAEEYLQEEVTDAVITVPAYFDDAQRQATKDAALIAGLNVKKIINEPTAAALAYGFDKNKSGNIIVYDLGGGTFDVSVLEIIHAKDENGKEILAFEVLSTDGDTFLGGENFDERIVNRLLEVLKKGEYENGSEKGVPLDGRKVPGILQNFKKEAEAAKIALSEKKKPHEGVDINISYVGLDDANLPIAFKYTLTRGELESLVSDLIEKTKEPCEKALNAANLEKKDISGVLLVGAQTRMPKIVEYVENLFGQKPLCDLAPQKIVAMGAAVQAGILDGQVKNVALNDVTPFNIGIKLADGSLDVLIPANSPIPGKYETKIENAFSTAKDNQPDVNIEIFQGARPKAEDNRFLGGFSFDIPPMPKGVPKIGLVLELDENGMLTVTAKDQTSPDPLKHKTRKETLQVNGGLSDEEVEKMKSAAEEHAEEDRLFMEGRTVQFEAQDQLEDATKLMEKEYYTSASDDLKAEFLATKEELTAAIDNKNIDAMKEKKQKMSDIISKVGLAFTQAAEASSDETPSNDNDTPAANNTTAPGGPS